MALPILDPAGFPYGGETLTIPTGGAATYITDDLTVDRPTKSIRRTNATDVPSGQAIIEDFVTGSATLQLALSSTALPACGDLFARTTPAETFIVTSVGERKAKGDVWTVSITFVKRINTP